MPQMPVEKVPLLLDVFVCRVNISGVNVRAAPLSDPQSHFAVDAGDIVGARHSNFLPAGHSACRAGLGHEYLLAAHAAPAVGYRRRPGVLENMFLAVAATTPT